MATRSKSLRKEETKMRKVINPDMDLKQEKATAEAEQPERESAKMPQVGTFPTGMKEAKKVTPGMG